MKICPYCAHENPASARKCAGCQADLAPGDASTLQHSKTTISKFDILTLEEGDIIDGRYRIIRKLGQGGMGAVYLVEDMELDNEQCAIKLIHPELVAHPEARQRFRSEVTTSRRLHHHGIIRVFDLGKSDDLYFFTMEYLDGRSLADELKARQGRVPPFSLEEVDTIFSRLLDALAYAHKQTVHRDIKPDNIFLCGEFPDIQVKILDFGIARTMSNSRFTQTVQGLGTPYYMAPEQLKNAHSADQRADIYGAGTILYELLTGAQAIGRFQLPSELISDQYKPFDEIIIKALAPDPDQRYADAREMLHAFRQAVDAVAGQEKEEKATPKTDQDTEGDDVLHSGQDSGVQTTLLPGRQKAVSGKHKPAMVVTAAVLVILALLGTGLYLFIHGSDDKKTQLVSTGPSAARIDRQEDSGYALQSGNNEAQKSELPAQARPAALTVYVQPSDARIEIVNGPEYEPGVELPPGRYTINISREGYIGQTRTIEIRPGADVIRSIELEPEQRQVERPATLTVSVQPSDARVEIVGGPEYEPGMELPPGNYEIRLSRQGYESQTWPLTLVAGGQYSPKFKLVRDLGRLTVIPSPADARVRILHIKPRYYDGIELKAGKYEIEVSRRGYYPYRQWIEIIPGESRTLRVSLTRKEGKKPVKCDFPCPPSLFIDMLPVELQKCCR